MKDKKYDLEKDFLPVGTIVKIRFNYDRLMIVGYCTVEEQTNKRYDYCAVKYPYGFIGSNQFIMFDKDVVKKVIRVGLEGEEEDKFIALLNKNIKEGNFITYDKE